MTRSTPPSSNKKTSTRSAKTRPAKAPVEPKPSSKEDSLDRRAHDLGRRMARDLLAVKRPGVGASREGRIRKRLDAFRCELVGVLTAEMAPSPEGSRGVLPLLRGLKARPEHQAMFCFLLEAGRLEEEGEALPEEEAPSPEEELCDPFLYSMESSAPGRMALNELAALFETPVVDFMESPLVALGFVRVNPGDPERSYFAERRRVRKGRRSRPHRRRPRAPQDKLMVSIPLEVQRAFEGTLPDPVGLLPARLVSASGNGPEAPVDAESVRELAEILEKQRRRAKQLAGWGVSPGKARGSDFLVAVECSSEMVGHATILAAASQAKLPLLQLEKIESIQPESEIYEFGEQPSRTDAMFRAAKLEGAALYVRNGADPAPEEDGPPLPFMLAGIERDAGLESVRLACKFEVPLLLLVPTREDLPRLLQDQVRVLRCALPSVEARASFLEGLAPDPIPGRDEVDWERLAQASVDVEQLSEAVRRGVFRAAEEEGFRLSTEDLLARLDEPRPQKRARLGAKDAVPTTRLEHVHLSEGVRSQVDDILAAVEARRCLGTRLGEMLSRYGQTLNCTALFHGPPGTGKTLTARAIAGEAGRPLRVVSIPSVTSCWVGQTEKKLRELLEDAERDGVVLLFDEADSLLMARSSTGSSLDRFSASVVNTFLQAIEAFAGVLIMTTNRRVVLDRAIARRISWQVEFPAPGPRERAAIWRSHLPADSYAGELDFEALGRRWSLHGGHIKAACMRAHFRAATAGRLLEAADIEQAAAEQTGADFDSTGREPVGFGR